jgi:hypothetical protein
MKGARRRRSEAPVVEPESTDLAELYRKLAKDALTALPLPPVTELSGQGETPVAEPDLSGQGETPVAEPDLFGQGETPVVEPETRQEEPPLLESQPTSAPERPSPVYDRPKRDTRPPDRYGNNIYAPVNSEVVPTPILRSPLERGGLKTPGKVFLDFPYHQANPVQQPKENSIRSCPFLGSYALHDELSHRASESTSETLPTNCQNKVSYISYDSKQSMGGGKKNFIRNSINNNKIIAEFRELFLGDEVTTTSAKNAAIVTHYRDFNTPTRNFTAAKVTDFYQNMEGSTNTNNSTTDPELLLDSTSDLEGELLSLDTEMEIDTEVEEWLNSEDRELMLSGEKPSEHTILDSVMEIVSKEIPQEVFKKPIVKVASKEEVIKNLNRLNTEEGERLESSQVHSKVLGTDSVGQTASSAVPTQAETRESQDSSCHENVNTSSSDLTIPTQNNILRCRISADTTPPIIGEREPGELSSDEDTSAPIESVNHINSYQHRTPNTAWVSAETIEKVKKAVGSDERGSFCTICSWRGSRKRTRVHTKQHFTVYMCTCGVAKVSRDSVYDHQISKLRRQEPGHGPKPGHIFEVDRETYTKFQQDHPNLGPAVFPELTPTQSGLTQKERRNAKRRESSAGMHKSDSRRSPIRYQPPTAPVLRIVPVRCPPNLAVSNPQQTIDLARELAERRERHSTTYLREAQRYEQEAAAALQASLRHSNDSPLYRQFQQRARRLTTEARKYRDAATFLHGAR